MAKQSTFVSDNLNPDISNNLFYVLLVVGITINATGLFTEILEPDSALYASIAKRIALTNDWVNLYGDGHDWLDKPHFPFWMAAISFKCFGINSFAYKLPSFLSWLIGIRFTYLLGKMMYNDAVARLATIIYITALHGVLENFDVRAEGYLTALTITAVYFIYKATQSGRLMQYVIAAFCSACAIMTKGIFVLFTIWGGFLVYWIVTKQWKQFIGYRIWLTLVLSFIFILPELYCLYSQFDLHPEKIVFNKTQVSGLRFFFWDSQFGRFFNSGPIKGEGDPFFFLHTLLWAFLPWSIIMYTAMVRLFINKEKRSHSKETYIIYGSAAITFLLFSLSRFQLPHYIILIFPQLALITAAGLMWLTVSRMSAKRILTSQRIIFVLVVVGCLALLFVTRFDGTLTAISFIAVANLLLFYNFRRALTENIILVSFVAFAILHLFLNVIFYPQLLQYQAGMLAGKWLRSQNYSGEVAMYKSNSYSLEFYAPVNVKRLTTIGSIDSCAAKENIILYTTDKDAAELAAGGLRVEVVKQYAFFPVSRLTLPFLYYETRDKELQQIVLAKISQK